MIHSSKENGGQSFESEDEDDLSDFEDFEAAYSRAQMEFTKEVMNYVVLLIL